MQEQVNNVAIYVRESRDDYGENFETIETQRDLLLDYAERNSLGRVYDIYMDDNVSGSGFDRSGLSRLKEDVAADRIDILLLKDLSRLGRNNAKTLQFLDFLEEYGVRVLSCDGRYDSLKDSDMAGIESWLNERYIKDISRKIRTSLHFKIQRGEYLGNAPFGYKKAEGAKNKLCIDEVEAETVRLIYGLYRSGLGYSAIASELTERGCPSPGGGSWNRISVRRILCSRVYLGDTVQGISEKVSFKSRKTRRLPEERWVVTQGTHEAIITSEQYYEVQKIREQKTGGRIKHKGKLYPLSCMVWCGRCGSVMYARKRSEGISYVCGSYFRKGRSACTSHFVYEDVILQCIRNEMKLLFSTAFKREELLQRIRESDISGFEAEKGIARAQLQLAAIQKQQELLYKDRLEGRISVQLFDKVNGELDERIKTLVRVLDRLRLKATESRDISSFIEEAGSIAESGEISNELVKMLVSRIIVYDSKDSPSDVEAGTIIIDFRMKPE